MKKKSTAFFLAAVMMLTGIIPGSAPSAAADLFSDGTVQTAERMKLREDG